MGVGLKPAKPNQQGEIPLLALLQVYQLGQLRKSEAIAESTKRGFPLQQLMTES
jgi:hypothetical protein